MAKQPVNVEKGKQGFQPTSRGEAPPTPTIPHDKKETPDTVTLENPKVSDVYLTFQELVEKHEEDSAIQNKWFRLAKDPTTPCEILDDLGENTEMDSVTLALVAAHQNTSPKMLGILAARWGPVPYRSFYRQECFRTIFHNVLKNPNTLPEDILPIHEEEYPKILEILASNKHPQVRKAVVEHPNTPTNTLNILVKDKDPSVRKIFTQSFGPIGILSTDFRRVSVQGVKPINPVLLDLNANLGLELGNDVVCPYCGRNRGSGHERYTQCPQRVIVSEPILVAPTIVPAMPQAPLLDTTKLLPVFDKKKAITQVEKETFPAYEQWVGNQFAGSLEEDEGSGFEQATVYAATPAGGTVVQNLINTPGIPSHLVEKLELLQQAALFEGKTGLEVLLFQKRAYMLADAPIEQYEKLDKILGEQLAEQKSAAETVLQAQSGLRDQDTVVGKNALVEDSVCTESYIESTSEVKNSTIESSLVKKHSKVNNSQVTNTSVDASTVEDSVVTDSLIKIGCQVNNSQVTNSQIFGHRGDNPYTTQLVKSIVLDSKIGKRSKVSNSTINRSTIKDCIVTNSTINGAKVDGVIDDSVLGGGVRVERGGTIVGIKVDVGNFRGDARVRGAKDVQQYSENGVVYTRYRNSNSSKFRKSYTYTSARLDVLTGEVEYEYSTVLLKGSEDKFGQVEDSPRIAVAAS